MTLKHPLHPAIVRVLKPSKTPNSLSLNPFQNSHNSTHFPPISTAMNPPIQNQESMLRESIKHFLTSYSSGSSDFSTFESIFFRLIQTMLDPPLEITWFYSAVTFHAAKLSNPSTRVLVAKDLFNLLISCSNLSSASKKIALLAPVVYELYSIVCDGGKRDVCEKMEVGKLVEKLVSYVVMSAGVYDYGNEDVECDNVVVCFEDLVRVWTTDRGGGSCNFGEILRIFFPLLTEGTWKGMNIRCGMRELVGIVLCEVFFLGLYVSFSSAMYKEDFLKDIRDQTVQTIEGFRNCYFLDMLLKMLSEPSLPVAASLSSEDAVLLQKVLYDAVILVDYSFYSGRWVESSVGQSKRLALAWVLAADHAIQFARATNDQASATSYLSAFCESQLVAELIKWVHSQAGMVDQNARPDITTPGALMKWLLVLQDQGIQIFDHSTSMLHAKAVACTLRVESDLWLTSNKTDASKKRKEAPVGVQESQIKQVRLDLSETSAEGNFLPLSGDGGARRGNVVINISSSSDDDDMEIVG